jgi:peroxiredoxin
MARTPSTMLPLGTSAPDFKLPDTTGKIVSLADFATKPALLVLFICNHCPYVKHLRAALAQTSSRAASASPPSVRTTRSNIPRTARR